jgi:hypothetical protein
LFGALIMFDRLPVEIEPGQIHPYYLAIEEIVEGFFHPNEPLHLVSGIEKSDASTIFSISGFWRPGLELRYGNFQP